MKFKAGDRVQHFARSTAPGTIIKALEDDPGAYEIRWDDSPKELHYHHWSFLTPIHDPNDVLKGLL